MKAVKKVIGLLLVMALCLALIPAVAYFWGGWYSYWGHAFLAIVFAVVAVFVKTRYYWEED
jgi:hypothetical protein